jgi:CheY-like chemotaxis protein
MIDEVLVPLSVLIVEDQADAAQSLAELLFLYGHTVRITACGKDALREVESSSPDVILLDIGLPGMDGWELARQLKSLSRPPVLIAITGYGQQEDHRRSDEAGIHIHLVKPVEPASLIGLLKRVAMTIVSSTPSDNSK